MPDPIDPTYFQRADAFINLANSQLSEAAGPHVAGSLTYADGRFNAWLCAKKYISAEQMKADREFNIKGLTGYFQKIVEENYDHYIDQFEHYFPIEVGSVTRKPIR